MTWEIGYDAENNRDIGYGVPATCDHPECHESINRGLSYRCSDCGLFFCWGHLEYSDHSQKCSQCLIGIEPFSPSPDTSEWTEWKMTDPSWQQWRESQSNDLRNKKN